MKKKILSCSALLTAGIVAVMSMFVLSSCGKENANVKEDTAQISDLSGEQNITETVLTEQEGTSKGETEENVRYDYNNFSDIAFLGNSRFIPLKDYDLAPNVYPVVGLDVRTAFTKHVDGSEAVVIDELDARSFDKVVLMFGDNECGWPNRDYFVKKYSDVIDAAREKQPDAKIYLHAIIPISSAASDKNECDCNNETIAELNVRIKQLAEDVGVEYIDVPECLLDEQGNLIDEAASDGVHLNKTYSSVWMGYFEEVLNK